MLKCGHRLRKRYREEWSSGIQLVTPEFVVTSIYSYSGMVTLSPVHCEILEKPHILSSWASLSYKQVFGWESFTVIANKYLQCTWHITDNDVGVEIKLINKKPCSYGFQRVEIKQQTEQTTKVYRKHDDECYGKMRNNEAEDWEDGSVAKNIHSKGTRTCVRIPSNHITSLVWLYVYSPTLGEVTGGSWDVESKSERHLIVCSVLYMGAHTWALATPRAPHTQHNTYTQRHTYHSTHTKARWSVTV